jgi:hypothetical protein
MVPVWASAGAAASITAAASVSTLRTRLMVHLLSIRSVDLSRCSSKRYARQSSVSAVSGKPLAGAAGMLTQGLRFLNLVLFVAFVALVVSVLTDLSSRAVAADTRRQPAGRAA